MKTTSPVDWDTHEHKFNLSFNLSQTKRIKVILKDILERHSEYCVGQEPSLEWMRALSTADIKAELGAYNGVGPKVERLENSRAVKLIL